ncbi:MAG TPA: hypothetical protein VME86_05625 [Acidobacteriaceae bacterium]|nr:hypothetical protein [Acidobacteriaceae bacterium]
MSRVVPRNSWLVVLVAALLIPAVVFGQEWHRGRKYKPPPPTCKITVTVTKKFDGKPLENASVVFHPIDKKGKDEGGMELKTDENGKATLNVIPIGDTLLLQVLAPGYQTFGNDYEIKTASREIAVEMRLPAQQYSIYQKHADTQVGGPKAEEKRAKTPNGLPPGTTD